ncbi:hypothetical protein N8H41_25350, partial [Pseudomonas vlassakiae]|nr:hypothetical protein [Pseudomonas vlassakiae]
AGRPTGPPALFFSDIKVFLKLKIDALSNPLIMRPTSSDIGTTNSLKFNELGSSGEVGGASVE